MAVPSATGMGEGAITCFFKASLHICRKHLRFFLSFLLFTKSKQMHLRLIVMITKITKAFICKKTFLYDWRFETYYANLILKDQLCGVWVLLCDFLEASCFLGIFSFSFIFMRFVVLVLCNIFTGSFLWTLHMRWMKELGLLYELASLIFLLALETPPEFRKLSDKSSSALLHWLHAAAHSFKIWKILLFHYSASWRDTLSQCQGIWKRRMKHSQELEPQNIFMTEYHVFNENCQLFIVQGWSGLLLLLLGRCLSVVTHQLFKTSREITAVRFPASWACAH